MSNTIKLDQPQHVTIIMGNPSDTGGAEVVEGTIVRTGDTLGGGAAYIFVYNRGVGLATLSARHGGYYCTAALPCPDFQTAALRNWGVEWDEYEDLAKTLAVHGRNLTSTAQIREVQKKLTQAA